MPTPPINPPSTAPDAHRAAGEPPSPSDTVNSTDLFKGQRTIAIQHNGAVYRLQATRQGKLILTK